MRKATITKGMHQGSRPSMSAKNAVACRILELCKARNISINSLALKAKMPPTTLYSLLNEKSQNPGIVTIERLCRTLDIDLHTFFDSTLFADDINRVQAPRSDC